MLSQIQKDKFNMQKVVNLGCLIHEFSGSKVWQYNPENKMLFRKPKSVFLFALLFALLPNFSAFLVALFDPFLCTFLTSLWVMTRCVIFCLKLSEGRSCIAARATVLPAGPILA